MKKHQDADIRQRAEKLFANSTIARRADVVAAYQTSLEKAGDVERGRVHFRKTCAACHKLEGVGESIGADLNAIKDRGTAAVMLNILDPNREVKPQFFSYVVALDSGRTVTGMIAAETANSLTLRKSDNTTETILRVNIEEIVSTGLSFMPEGLGETTGRRRYGRPVGLLECDKVATKHVMSFNPQPEAQADRRPADFFERRLTLIPFGCTTRVKRSRYGTSQTRYGASVLSVPPVDALLCEARSNEEMGHATSASG